ncbi:hypothetical protein FKG94_09800 [Exilibacterium tricleocarpae]|uniref:Chemotaxis protein n=1 Tax=Exilibacterium tricleocarpae TaxID=2591008 RepID=A0A545TW00_9GAMM|nr:hypothetical protein [Exilibacterium tricleocarpae]TQV81374.1 hypothetical protein FKG94_09800 [Exilibacterium tricleocarpae]
MATNIVESGNPTPAPGMSATQSLEQNWCHIQETITMLYLAVCQIETAVVESGDSMDQLTLSFTKLAQHTKEVNRRLQEVSEPDQLGQLKHSVSLNAEETDGRVSEAVTAFQFYDRISQRLDHVARSLERMTEIMGTTDKIHDPKAWEEIQAEVKSSYSMEAERIMFEHIMQGASVKEALEIYRHHFDAEDVGREDNGDEVELF